MPSPRVIRGFTVEAWIEEKGGFIVLESPDQKTVQEGDWVRLTVLRGINNICFMKGAFWE